MSKSTTTSAPAEPGGPDLKPRRRRRGLRWLALVLWSLLVGLLLLEIALRVHDPFGFRVHGNRLALPVNTRYEWPCGVPPFDEVIIHTKNSLGFRGPDPGPDFAARVSVVCVGGSTTEGMMLSDGTDWPAVMAERLAPRVPGLWVNNAGLDGHSTFGHAVLVESSLAALRPGVAVFLIGRNELWNDRPNRFDAATAAGRRPPSAGQALSVWLAEHSRVASMVLNLVRYREAVRRGQTYFGLRTIRGDDGLQYARLMVRDPSRGPRLAPDPARTEALLAEHRARYLGPYRERLAELIRLTRQCGITPVLVTQPVLPGYEPPDAPDQAEDLAAWEVVRGVDGASFRALMDLYNRTLVECAQTEGVAVMDLAARLPRRRVYFYDDSHFTREGAAAVGAILAEELAPILERMPRPPRGAE